MVFLLKQCNSRPACTTCLLLLLRQAAKWLQFWYQLSKSDISLTCVHFRLINSRLIEHVVLYFNTNSHSITFQTFTPLQTVNTQKLFHVKPAGIQDFMRLLKKIPVTTWSKAWVCGHSLTCTVGSNPTGGRDVCLLWVLCVVRYRSLHLTYYLSRGILQSVTCLSVIMKPR
jgi:hypothetical protein